MLNLFKIREFYKREDVKQAIINLARDREIAIKLYNGSFAKRPLSINNFREYDLIMLKKPVSFHTSEERWINVELLNEQKKEIINENRKGWDLIIDIDGKFEYSKIVAEEILKFFNSIDIKHTSIKFSGNKGFHIGIPWEAFSEEIIGIGKTKDLFPEAPQKIVKYILYEIEEKIAENILNYEGSFEKIAENNNLTIKEIRDNNGKLILNKLVEIDTLLISSRHLFRMTYSINEKSGLVSIPINPKKLSNFKKSFARIENVRPEYNKYFEFLNYKETYGKYGDKLLIKAYDNDYETVLFQDHFFKGEKDLTIEINEVIPENRFPETIKYLLNYKLEDGRKRALFVLLSFLTYVNWDFENVDKLIKKWGDLQEIKQNYLEGQINWFKRLNHKIIPPNFDKKMYYEDIGIPLEVLDKDRNFRKKNNKNLLQAIRKK